MKNEKKRRKRHPFFSPLPPSANTHFDPLSSPADAPAQSAATASGGAEERAVMRPVSSPEMARVVIEFVVVKGRTPLRSGLLWRRAAATRAGEAPCLQLEADGPHRREERTLEERMVVGGKERQKGEGKKCFFSFFGATSVSTSALAFCSSSLLLSLSLSSSSLHKHHDATEMSQPDASSRQKGVSFAEGDEAAVTMTPAPASSNSKSMPADAPASSGGKAPSRSSLSMERPSMATRESEVLRATARESMAMLLEGNARFCAVRERRERD